MAIVTTRGWKSFISAPAIAVALASFASCPVTTARADDTPLKMLTEVSPPLSWETDGKADGPAVRLVDEVLTAAGIPHVIEVQPWARGFHNLETRADVCLFGTGRTAEREDRFQWAGPIAHGGVALYAVKEFRKLVHDVADINALGLTVGVKRQDITERVALAAGIANLSVTTNEENLVEMLKYDRFDLWAGGKLTGRTRLEEGGLPHAREVLTLTEVPVSVACNKGVDPAKVAALDAGIGAATASGRRDAIFAEFSGANHVAGK